MTLQDYVKCIILPAAEESRARIESSMLNEGWLKCRRPKKDGWYWRRGPRYKEEDFDISPVLPVSPMLRVRIPSGVYTGN